MPPNSGVPVESRAELSEWSAEADKARLPATYEEACKALWKCSRIDECKSWADKAAALASYARQAKDDSLRAMAERIQARAVRRCGELLKDIPSGQGSRNQHGQLRDGAVTRQEAARRAGLSERQKVTALRVARVPGQQFEALLEGEAPPSVAKLAALGSRAGAPTRSAHPDSLRAARARKTFWGIREFCEQNSPADLAGTFTSHDGDSLREFASALQTWLDEFVAHLPEDRPKG